MDKKLKKQIMVRIGDIIEGNCRGCPLHYKSSVKNLRNEHCMEKCEHGIELRKLGGVLDNGFR